MKESIFRKESLEKINSPGQMNRYIRVAEPGMWIALASIALLLLGVLIWGIFGSIETTVPACAAAEETGAVCYIDAKDAGGIEADMEVRANGMRGKIISVSGESMAVPASAADYLDAAACVSALTDLELPAGGVFEAEIVLERIAPISFVLQ